MHVVITGGSSGIGLALVNAYLSQNYKVSTCSRKQNNITPHTSLFFQMVDVSNKNDCELFIQNAIAKHGPITILITNAGISMNALVANTQLQVIEQVMNINFYGAVYCIKAALPSLLQTNGVICGISSIAGYRGLPARSGYSASKHALQGFLESLRTELLHTGVHTMWVAPGFTASNIRFTALNSQAQPMADSPINEASLMSSEQCAAYICKAIAKRKRSLILTTQGKFTTWLNKWWPSLADKLVYNHFAKQQKL
jgi:short-subunit dehydrogenase